MKRTGGDKLQLSKSVLRRVARRARIPLRDEEVGQFTEMLNQVLHSFYGALERIPVAPPARSERKWRRPSRDEDPLNLFITKCDIQETQAGPLAGMRIGVKDCIGVAGVPLTMASRALEGFVAKTDATVIERLLAAGARIVGKTNLDEFYVDTTSETSQFGPTGNPKLGDGYVPGGSSGGSAAAVAAGAVDAALGTDGAGSTRVPAAFCGVVGLKPTHGRVPGFGAVDMMPSVDEIGILANDVATIARVLGVIAGPDPRDARSIERGPEDYVSALAAGMPTLRVGIVKEFFDEALQPAVRDAVRDGIRNLERLGCSVREVSLPAFEYAAAVWMAYASAEQSVNFRNDGVCVTSGGAYDEDWLEAFAKVRRSRRPHFGRSIRLIVLLGAFLGEVQRNRHYAMAANRRFQVIADCRRAFNELDVLVSPTIPMLPFKLGELDAYGGSFSTIPYTCPINLVGLPALSLPCKKVDGRYVGMQLIGKWLDERTVLRLAYAYERNIRME
ncbi:MAG: amidase [Candidatus Binatia bacterium]